MKVYNFFVRKIEFKNVLPAFMCVGFSLGLLNTNQGLAQAGMLTDTALSANGKTIIAGKQYTRSSLHDWLWGHHYRKEWATPVRVKQLNLDTAFGGLIPLQKGGGRQTSSLRLQAKNGQQYVLRSIDKTYTKALPKIYQGTFVEAIANDQVSVAHPYAALTVPMLAEAAKVYHTNPQIVYLPNDENLGIYRKEFGNKLYLLEERPAGFEGDANNFGNTEDVDGTEKMLRKILEENDRRVDQAAFVRARLFDMFLSDWSRHEDQWRWATFNEGDGKIYRPIPRDRDQAFTKFDGLLVGIGSQAANLVYLQSVDYTIKNIKGYNFQARHLDRQLANEPTLQTWINIATELQQLLTNQVIENALLQLPPEVYTISGAELTAKLKSRRDHLVDFAKEYYKVLAREVDIAGTDKKELLQVTGLNDQEVKVELFDLNNEDQPKEKPFYSRIFKADETREIRVYGLNGNDRFKVTGTTNRAIEIRLIGGPKKDSFSVPESFKGRIKIYDNQDNTFNISSGTKMHLANDSAVHEFDYSGYKPNASGIKAGASYNNEDRVFLRLGFRIQRYQWRKSPYGYHGDFNVNYSITQKAFSVEYKGYYNKIAGNWNLGLLAQYDDIRDVHFFGIGNNTKMETKQPNYYRYEKHEADVALSLYQTFKKHNTISFSAFYQMVEVLPNIDRFISIVYAPANKTLFNKDNFAGIRANYIFTTVNDKVFPTRGITFSTEADYIQNLTKAGKSVATLSGVFGFYIPLAQSLTLAVKTGAATLTGEPEFYQYNRLGSGRTIRGFTRYRFYGRTAVYNQNELQWSFNVRSFILNGRMGLVALFDNGRVWQPGEVSNLWHSGVGGGIMIAPFNRVSITGTYAKSNEDARLSVRIGKLF